MYGSRDTASVGYSLKGIVGAVVIFDHGLKFGIVFLVSDHPAHEKLIASE